MRVGRLELDRVLLAFMIAAISTGCGSGKHSFLTVQACLSDSSGVEAFISDMRAVAHAENMEFIDRSEETARELKATGYLAPERTFGSRLVNIGIQRSDGLGVTAGNLGLPGYEIALGFTEGRNAEAARAFADRVVKRLGSRWPMTQVPSGMGAKPQGGCP